MIRCEKCFYPLEEGQVNCPECNHPTALSRKAFDTRGVSVNETELRRLKVVTVTILCLLIVTVVTFVLRGFNDILQSKLVYLGSWWVLASILVTLGIAVLFLSGFRQILTVLIAASFMGMGLLILWQGLLKPGNVRFEFVNAICGAAIPILLGALLMQLRGTFIKIRARPGSVRSFRALILLGLICAIALIFKLPTEQGARGLVVLANIAAMTFIFIELSKLLFKSATAIPAPP